jgi:hypothetical protein
MLTITPVPTPIRFGEHANEGRGQRLVHAGLQDEDGGYCCPHPACRPGPVVDCQCCQGADHRLGGEEQGLGEADLALGAHGVQKGHTVIMQVRARHCMFAMQTQ